MDISDVAGNVKDGVHIACMGGTWMIFVYGFAGLRDYDGTLRFNPRISKNFKHVKFPLMFRGQRLEVSIKSDSVTYTLKKGTTLRIFHRDQEINLSPNKPVTMPIELVQV